MNRSYRSVWNTALGAWVAVSEITQTCGKRSSATVGASTLLLLLGIALTAAFPVNAADYYYTSTGNTLFNQSPYGGFGGGKPLANDRAIYNQGSGATVYVTDSLPVGQFVYQAPYTGTGFTLSTSPFSFAGMLTINGIDGLGVDSQVNQQIIMSGRTTLGGSQEWRISSDSGSIRQWTNMNSAGRTPSLVLGAHTLTLNPMNAANSFDLDTPISGTGGLVAIGAGIVRLNAVNTYTGGTTMNGGTIQVAADNNLGDATGVLSFGGGTLHTTASFTTNRATTLNAGGGSFNTDSGTTLVQNSVISGIGGLGKEGAGTLQLTKVNTYTGATTINAGTLSLTGTGSIAQSSKVVANGTFNISGTSSGASIQSLSGSNSGIVTLGTKTLIITNANDTFAGSVQGTGGLTLSSGNLTLTGNNTFTGSRNITGGNLRLENGGQISASVTTAASAISSGSLVVTGLNSYFKANSLTVGDNAQAQFRIENGAKSDMTSTLTIGRNSGTGHVTVTGAGSVMTTSGVIMGQGAGSQGFLDITDGAKVYSAGIQFSQLVPDGWGVANVSGAGS
ncbi:MAG: ESPR-type extended signal peptide-containing protein, partial [Pseudomonadota bacterium]